ncbi:AMP-binding protein [Sorangium sp. So ce131]|uniref:AMP-binding protein n=1 Tax=Sorangium sp. So ce131 TaxID=3133282 RepID=UPI003F5FA5A4
MKERFGGVVGHVCQAGSRFDVQITYAQPLHHATFGLWLTELDRQGQLIRVIGSYLAATHRVLIQFQEPRTDVLEVYISEATRPQIDEFLLALESALEAVAHRRSDVLLRHLTGKRPPEHVPYLESDQAIDVRVDEHVEADGVVSVLARPRTAWSMARLDSSLLSYDDDEASAVGRVLGRILNPFLLPPTFASVGRKAIKVNRVCLPGFLEETRDDAAATVEPALAFIEEPPGHRVGICSQVAESLGKHEDGSVDRGRFYDGLLAAKTLLRLVVEKVFETGLSRDGSFTIVPLGADPEDHLDFRARLPFATWDDSPSTQAAPESGVVIYAVFPAAHPESIELRQDSVVVDIFGVLSLKPDLESLAKNIIYVRGASIRVGDGDVLTGPLSLNDPADPALLVSLLAELDDPERRRVGSPRSAREFELLAEKLGLEIGCLRGFWGEIHRSDWDAFHARRTGDVAPFKISSSVTAASPPVANVREKSINICDYIFSPSHLLSGSVVINPVTGESTSYAGLQRLASVYAHCCRRIGVQQGDVVALVAPDGIASVAIMAACFMGGWVFSPLNYSTATDKLDCMIRAIAPRVVIYDPAAASNHLPTIHQRPCYDLDELLRLHDPGDTAEPVEPLSLPPDAPAAILFTSGSTGTPKAVAHSHGDFVTCSRNYRVCVPKITSSDCVYTASRSFFAYGLNNLIMSLCAGASHVLATPLDGRRDIARLIGDYRVSVFFAVPAIYKQVLSKHGPRGRFPALRLCISAGEKLPAKLFREVQEAFAVDVIDGIGNTEAISTFISNRERSTSPGCTGMVVPGFAVKLINDRGELCRVGEVGILWVKGDTLANGYMGDAANSQQYFVDGWFNTQDLFFMDADYRFYSVGRAGSVIKINACWLSPELIESALQTHPAVKECAVCIVKDSYGLPRPKAFVVLADHFACEPDPRSLWSELRKLSIDKLGKDHYPHIFATIDALPRTTSGKLIRSESAYPPG